MKAVTRPRSALAAVVSLLVAAAACSLAACSSSIGGASGPDGGDDSSTPDTGNGTDSASSDTGSGNDGSRGDATTSDADASTHDGTTGSDATTDTTSNGDGSENDASGPVYPPVYPDAGAGCAIGPYGEPLDLACTGLYSDWASKTVAPGNQAYGLGYVFWSDGATKQRWIALPPGTQIDTSDMDEWVFPVNTRIWKEFSLVLPEAGAPLRIETRLIWKWAPGLWYRTAYRWSSDGQTSATELTNGQTNVDGTTYEIPSQSDCDDCHRGRRDGVLGFEAVGLSASSATGLTMAQLEAQSLITTMPTGSLTVPGDPTAMATLGFLHINCGVPCHNSGAGLAGSTGFHMRLEAAELSSVEATDTYTTGWNHLTHNFTIPDAGQTYRFHACDLSESAAYYRPDHRTGVNGTPSGVQMPPIVTHEVDDVAMATLAAWINESCDDGGTDQ